MSELYNVESKTYTNLLADPIGADIIGIPCTPGNGTVKAGTVMYRGDTGMYAPAASANVSDNNMLAVLKEDVSTGSDDATTAAEAAAYRAGCFIDGAVKLTSNAALSDANKVVLRKQGIVFDKKQSTATFNNVVSSEDDD